MAGVVRKIIKTVKAPSAIGPYRLVPIVVSTLYVKMILKM
jgi:hypothetical protein